MSVAFDNATPYASNSALATHSFSHTVAGSDRYIVVVVANRRVSGNITGVTYSSVAMTQVGSTLNIGNANFSIWELIAPATGANTVAVSITVGGRAAIVAASYTGVDQTTPKGTVATAGAPTNTSTPSITIAGATGELAVGFFGMEEDGASNTISANAGTLRGQTTTTTGTADPGAAISDIASGTSVAVSWTLGSSDNWRTAGFSLKPVTATTNTFYLLDTAASSSSHGQLQLDGSAPTSATTGTGWTVGSSAVDTYALLSYGTEQAFTAFGATALPSGAPGATDCWRSASTITGQYAAGDWDFSFALRAVDQGGTQDGAIRVRLWRSTDPTGSGATEITSGATQLSTMTNIATGSDSTSTGTITLGAVTLAAEYLFVQVAYRVTGAA